MHEIVAIRAHWYKADATFCTADRLAEILDTSVEPMIVDGVITSNGSVDVNKTFTAVDPKKAHQTWDGDGGEMWSNDEWLKTTKEFVHFEFMPVTGQSPYITERDEWAYMQSMRQWRSKYDLYADNIKEVWDYIRSIVIPNPKSKVSVMPREPQWYGTYTVLTLWDVSINCSKDEEGFTDCEDEWGMIGILDINKLPSALVGRSDNG